MLGSYNRNAKAICFCFIFCADGLRTSRSHTHNGTTTTWEYVYNGSQLTQMKKGNDTLYFTYDASGTPTTVTHNGTVYYYVTNLQGDVVKIVSATGTTVATYTYDAWGNPISTTNTTPSTLETLNPLRYRGYVYDPETELYYLQSRYYNPEIGRWINADGVIAGVGGSIQGYNMFAYCMNNPVNTFDSTGNWPKWIEKGANWLDENVVAPIEKLVADVCKDINSFDTENDDESKVLESKYFSCYKGKLVLRTDFRRSGSCGVLFISRELPNSNAGFDEVRHEYGHTKQLGELGLGKYTVCIVIPSLFEWGTDKEYYRRPWEITADLYGGVQTRNYPGYEAAGYEYMENSRKWGIFAWLTIK